MSRSKSYAGIGSREVPWEIAALMDALAESFAEKGWQLRSGGAKGSDTAFEVGADRAAGRKEIFLPWEGYEDNPSTLYKINPKSFAIAAAGHPNWGNLKEGAKKMMARNCNQVLGPQLDDPVVMVVCWTPDGCIERKTRTPKTGGTGQAIALAADSGIPVYNLKRNDHYLKAIALAGEERYKQRMQEYEYLIQNGLPLPKVNVKKVRNASFSGDF